MTTLASRFIEPSIAAQRAYRRHRPVAILALHRQSAIGVHSVMVNSTDKLWLRAGMAQQTSGAIGQKSHETPRMRIRHIGMLGMHDLGQRPHPGGTGSGDRAARMADNARNRFSILLHGSYKASGIITDRAQHLRVKTRT